MGIGQDVLEGVDGGAAVGLVHGRGVPGSEPVEGVEIALDVWLSEPADDVEDGGLGVVGEAIEVEIDADVGLEEFFIAIVHGRKRAAMRVLTT